MKQRFDSWDRTVFGPRVRPVEVAEAMQHLLLGQPIDQMPVARPEAVSAPLPRLPFLQVIDRPDLLVALPPTLDVLAGGLPAVNASLAERRLAPLHVALPSVAEPRLCVHGGLFYPGEAPARAIPDLVTLRLRFIANVPHAALLVALLLAHRRSRGRLALRGGRRGPVQVFVAGRSMGPFLDLADAWMRGQGWCVSRRFRGGMSGEVFQDLATGLHIASTAGRALVLDEDFFCRLQVEPEDREIFDGLSPLADRLEADLGRTG